MTLRPNWESRRCIGDGHWRYQEESAQIRLTARFVRVETSEIIGSAKVDGSVKQFFRLQDRVTAELLRSAGMPELARKVVDGTEARPDLKTIGRWICGQAVTAETISRNWFFVVGGGH